MTGAWTNILGPRLHRLKKTHGSGDQIVNECFLHEVFSFKPSYNLVSALQEMSPNVFQTRNFAGEIIWRENEIEGKFALIPFQMPETASELNLM